MGPTASPYYPSTPTQPPMMTCTEKQERVNTVVVSMLGICGIITAILTVAFVYIASMSNIGDVSNLRFGNTLDMTVPVFYPTFRKEKNTQPIKMVNMKKRSPMNYTHFH